jgi:hypothetical protein
VEPEYYRVQETPPLVHILSQMNPFHDLAGAHYIEQNEMNRIEPRPIFPVAVACWHMSGFTFQVNTID